VSPSACVRAAVCTCTVSEYSTRTSHAHMREGGRAPNTKKRNAPENTGSEQMSWCQVRLQIYAIKPCAFKFVRPCMRRHTPGLKAQGDTSLHPKTQGASIRLGAKLGSKLTASSLVSLSTCVRAAVCACTVSKYGAHTSRAQVGSSS
jgi:hypothetical protein